MRLRFNSSQQDSAKNVEELEPALSLSLCRHVTYKTNPWFSLKCFQHFGHLILLYISNMANSGIFTVQLRCTYHFLKLKLARVGCLLSKTLFFFNIALSISVIKANENNYYSTINVNQFQSYLYNNISNKRNFRRKNII